MVTIIKASQIVEVEIKSVNKDQTIGRQDVLAGKRIKSIVAYPSGLDTEGRTLANLENAYLELREVDGSNKDSVNIPIRSLIYDGGYPLLQFVGIGDRPIDWINSKVKFAAAPTVGQVIQLLVIYEP